MVAMFSNGWARISDHFFALEPSRCQKGFFLWFFRFSLGLSVDLNDLVRPFKKIPYPLTLRLRCALGFLETYEL